MVDVKGVKNLFLLTHIDRLVTYKRKLCFLIIATLQNVNFFLRKQCLSFTSNAGYSRNPNIICFGFSILVLVFPPHCKHFNIGKNLSVVHYVQYKIPFHQIKKALLQLLCIIRY